ncbi:unnamed protein product [Toxocara canis]|uniref:Vps52 C-terminal domain-containing protein n=1 Tax=Toxocara canis TaxID=6265 RepID=A0A3P7FNQ4_TOXCA|nr:unnamed protein product [Toxocara canis]
MSDAATKDDLLGAEDAVKATGFFSSKPQVRNRATVFSLGTRESLLSFDFLAPLIVPHAAQQANERVSAFTLFFFGFVFLNQAFIQLSLFSGLI